MTHFDTLSRVGKSDILRGGRQVFDGDFQKNAQNRSFQPAWFERFKWIEYNGETKGAQCFYCKYLAPPTTKNDEFRAGKVNNWKNLIEKAGQHEQSAEHKRCVTDAQRLIEAETQRELTLKDKLIKASDTEKERNRKGVIILFSVVRWLATQNIAFRGHESDDGNFHSFLQTFRSFMPDLDSFLTACPKNATYMTWKIQNEFIQIIDQLVVHEVLRPIISSKKPFSVIMDETTDASTKLQVAISIRYTNEKTGSPQEHLVAMVESASSTGESLSNKLLEVLSELGLDLEQLVGQGYDGGSNMRGDIQGVQAWIREKCPRALYTWCWSHSLQLVMSHAADESVAAVDCFRKIKEVYACISSSAHRTTIMERHLLENDLLVDEKADEEAELRCIEQTEAEDDNHTSVDSCNTTDTEQAAKPDQKRDQKYRRLLSISGTRFIARTRNLRIFNKRLPQIREALVEMGLDSIANSLDARFQATVSALYTILCPISDLSQALQTPDLNLLGAQQHLDLLSVHRAGLWTEVEYQQLLAVAACTSSTGNSDEAVIEEVRRPQRKRSLPADLNDSVVMHAMPIWSTNERATPILLIHEYYEILDLVKQQIASRFDSPVLTALANLI